ncbi:hypothetical protein FBEOM_12155 [Fusarium beomiforme]|uniref:FAD-binding domain-containing protein n=1 Tax=Fusarium beomiforme TaxID=44412 RepID=A0A9P5A9Q8_9HYPO|nr:hypothetical protein FBEOM_12155 [Fusarium beomiforme]
MKVVIVGAGLGGIACGIACKRQGLDVTILERAPELSEIGAGIQVPANACRALDYIGVFGKVKDKATEILTRHLRRWDNGDVLATPAELGVNIRTGVYVEGADFDATEVILDNDERVKADVIIGADGIWSTLRSQVVGETIEPTETGDLAYRGTFTHHQLEELNDPEVIRFCEENKQTLTLWLGPAKHAVFYAIRGGELWNLVLLTPDTLKKGQRTDQGDLEEMRKEFEGWDPISKRNVALLGDSAHPTLPYQSQGAAMAFGDAAVLGTLLGKFHKTDKERLAARGMMLHNVLDIYESLQKPYSSLNVKGAVMNRIMYHLPDGEEQQQRDLEFSTMTSESKSEWTWIDGQYQRQIIGTDLIKMAMDKFDSKLNVSGTGLECSL